MVLRNGPKEDIGNFPPTDFVLGHPIRSLGNSSTLVTTTVPNPILMLLSASLDIMSHPYVSCHPAKQIEPPTWTKICFHLLRVDSHRSPLQPVNQGPYKVLAKFSILNKHFKLDMRHGINNVSIDRIKTAQIPSVPSPIVTTTRGRVVLPPPKSLATTVCNVFVFCFDFGVHCTYHLFYTAASRKQTSLDAASAHCCAMVFTAGSAVARAVELRRGFCRLCN